MEMGILSSHSRLKRKKSLFSPKFFDMEVINLSEFSSIFNQYLAEIRDHEIQRDPLRFRRNLQRSGEVFAYEISKTLDFKVNEVKTPLGVAKVPTLTQQPVLATILRAGLPLQQGLLNVFDRAENAFISAYRKYDDNGEFHIEFEYLASPDLNEKVAILSDPMLASGASMEIGYKALLKKGDPSHIHMVAIIASKKGVEYVKEKIKADNVTLWVGAIDDEMTVKSYIVPGLGDAGDLAFGPKIDSH
ncbi:uracil phosphoribosyltransferase [Sunxiuqinia elliptica]|uniref:Uracil phosphoribosyltransferase n=2 Tax=Sunxiuqinia elliptica TaxID=655355 RepID=A0A1I2C4R3_9BACT|nr:uracil phosphoribosyltransferase [Sunxiuqinia elliptica]TDO62075.1 uracil phosphoribosyltransferase [Sunxiuqinia elliptica]SFE63426.1 uracil phosphoribosyltransferase [Sunxiuqinia elliptica]